MGGGCEGRNFGVEYDALEKLERGEVSLFEDFEGANPQLPVELLALFGRLFVEGHVLLPEGGVRLNGRFPELEVLTVEGMTGENWRERGRERWQWLSIFHCVGEGNVNYPYLKLREVSKFLIKLFV